MDRGTVTTLSAGRVTTERVAASRITVGQLAAGTITTARIFPSAIAVGPPTAIRPTRRDEGRS